MTQIVTYGGVPTIHVGASLMLNLRHFHPARFRTIRGVDLEHRLAFAGAPTGLSATFNAPLVNAVFAINELTRSFEARMSGVILRKLSDRWLGQGMRGRCRAISDHRGEHRVRDPSVRCTRR
ncbi:chloride channel protein [Paraburkholderia sp. Cpub6]|uniref:chloride channel protein n=1 Tax=Paraburkholderia sp. Cpub6 TaxID=2723094 RepID=UPI001822B94C|nr:chloride channel protein [Paraburkholderia sp. Cpub6]MBB5461112.1 H+/Cl- antiporter ClcA [Paraburkholderia sp. Cpub6]